MYLCEHYEDKRLAEVLYFIACKNGKENYDDRMYEPMINDIDEESHEIAEPTEAKTAQFKDLFKGSTLGPVLSLSMVYILSNFATSGLTFFMPEILPLESKSEKYTVILIQSVFSLPGMLLSCALINTRLGRVGTMAFGFIMTGLTLIPMMCTTNYLLVLVFSASNNMFSNLAFSTLTIITPESFETDIRSLSSGWLMAISKFAGIISPIITAKLLMGSGMVAALSLSAVGFLMVGGLSFMLKETKPVNRIKHD